jgi:S1-C subfamily serine protease
MKAKALLSVSSLLLCVSAFGVACRGKQWRRPLSGSRSKTSTASSAGNGSASALGQAGASATQLGPLSSAPPNLCTGAYADSFSALAPDIARLEAQLASYTFCIRSAATYECLSYGVDGELDQRRKRSVTHGTAFAYERGGRGTLLLTNQHVSDWPAVTDDDHAVEGVPNGCKRVGTELSIVESEGDSYEHDDVPLEQVVADPHLDIAVLTTARKLPILPWRIGESSQLEERNVVDVRGFPLGILDATSTGQVVSSRDHDTKKDWDHDDFVIDASLSPGNAGSPVLAISCKTGAFELVGVYHTRVVRSSPLNAVIGIDQLRNLMSTLKRVPRPGDTRTDPDAAARARLETASVHALDPYFPLGPLTAALRTLPDGRIYYEVLNEYFPTRAYPTIVLEDLPAPESDDFGKLGRVWFGSTAGLESREWSDLDVEARLQLQKLLGALRKASVAAFALRETDPMASASRERAAENARLDEALQHLKATQRDQAQMALDLVRRLAPRAGAGSETLRSILSKPESEKLLPPISLPKPEGAAKPNLE